MNNKCNTIHTVNKYRILEVLEDYYDLDDLKGDGYKAEHNPEIDVATLKSDELKFEETVYNKGVYGYILEYWNPEIGEGWTTIDSCWGFIGQHEEFNHEIVEEFLCEIKNRLCNDEVA